METNETSGEPAYDWDFGALDRAGPAPPWRTVGACTVGSPVDAEPGMQCVEFIGGHLEAVKADDIRIAVQGGFTIYVRFFLSGVYLDMTDRRDAVLCEWTGFDTAEKPERHFVSLEILSIGFVPGNRYLGFWVDNCFPSVSIKDLEPDSWHDVALRVTGSGAELLVDGVLRSLKDIRHNTLTANPTGNAAFLAANYFRVGSDWRDRFPFEGRIRRVVVWNRPLQDTELADLLGVSTLCKDYPEPKDSRTNWAGLYEEDIALEDAYKRMYADYVDFYRRALKEDAYFPRYHLTMPGFMSEPSTSSYKTDGYHVFPHGHVSWGNVTYAKNAHYWHHLSSRDLLRWKLMPFPEWSQPRAGNIVELDGKGISFAQIFPRDGMAQNDFVIEKWSSSDKELQHWVCEKRVPLPRPLSGVMPPDNYIFRYDGRWYLLCGYAGMTNRYSHTATRGRMELYRATDDTLDAWAYVGEFYQGTGLTVHHPQLYFVQDEAVMSSDLPIDDDVEYVLGRIENMKFVREGGGFYEFGYRGGCWGQTVTEGNGRVLRWALIRDLKSRNNLVGDMVRRGWEHAYSLPRVVGVEDGALTFEPAEELRGLRKSALFAARERLVHDGRSFFPELSGDTAQVEVRCRFRVGEKGRSGVVLQAEDDDIIRYYYDHGKAELVLDFSRSKYGGKHNGAGLPTCPAVPLERARGESLELRVFYDHSIVEVYAEGLCSTGTWFPDDPAGVRPGLFSQEAETDFEEVSIWEVDTIWREYE